MSWSVYFVAVVLAVFGVVVLAAGESPFIGGLLVGFAVFLGRVSGSVKAA